MHRRRLSHAIALAVAATLMLSACGSGASKPAAPATPAAPGVPPAAAGAPGPAVQAPTTTFRMPISTAPSTFDPAMVSDANTRVSMVQNVYSGLVYYDLKGNVIPDLAQSWQISEDGKTYTFTLRDARFHNGRKVTAEDVQFSIIRAFNPKLNSPTARSYLNDITGAARYVARRADIDQQLQAQKIDKAGADQAIATAYQEFKQNPGIMSKDEKTLVIQIDAPKPYFLSKLTYAPSFPVDRTVVKEDVPIAATPENVKLVVGTGPFTLADYVDKSKIVLKRNPDFYGDRARVGAVEVSIVTNEAANLAAYRSGQLDVTTVPNTDYLTIKKGPEAQEILEMPFAGVSYIALNQNKVEAFRDQKVRQAFAHALDKQKLVEVALGGVGYPAWGILPTGIPGALGEQVKGLSHDPARARQLLTEAGYGPGGRPFPTVKLTFTGTSDATRRWAEFIQNQFQTHLGIKVDLDPMEYGKLLSESVKRTSLDMYVAGWNADYFDPQNFLSLLMHGKAAYNRFGFNNRDFDAVLDKADVAPPGPERFSLYSQAEQIAVNDVAWVTSHFGKFVRLVKPHVKGYKVSAMSIMRFNHVEISK